VEKLQTELTIPSAVVFIETTDIIETVKLTTDGIEVAEVDENGDTTCSNGATENDDGNCEIQECAFSGVHDAVVHAMENTIVLLEDNPELSKFRNRKAR